MTQLSVKIEAKHLKKKGWLLALAGRLRLLAVSGENRVALSPPYGPEVSLGRSLTVSAFAVQGGLSYFLTAGPFLWNRP